MSPLDLSLIMPNVREQDLMFLRGMLALDPLLRWTAADVRHATSSFNTFSFALQALIRSEYFFEDVPCACANHELSILCP